MVETHYQRMIRHGVHCTPDHLTFGGRCLNCGYTPPDHKATLWSPRLDLTLDKQEEVQ